MDKNEQMTAERAVREADQCIADLMDADVLTSEGQRLATIAALAISNLLDHVRAEAR